MSKVLTQQNALRPQQSKKAENHKKTAPTVQKHNNNCSSNSGGGMTGKKASSALACSSESPSTSSSPVTVDYDDFTSSSILEFLEREQECCTDADAESIFQEVGRLADNTDTRSVDEILREAELLMQQQTLLGNTTPPTLSVSQQGKKRHIYDVEKNRIPLNKQPETLLLPIKSIQLNSKYTKRFENVCQSSMADVSRARLPNGHCNYQELIQSQYKNSHSSTHATPTVSSSAATPITPTAIITPHTQIPSPTSTAGVTPLNGNHRFDVFIENLPSVSVISEESKPRDIQNMTATEAGVTTIALLNGDDDDDTDTVEEITEGIDNIELVLNGKGAPAEAESNNTHSNDSNEGVDDVTEADNMRTNELADDCDDDDDVDGDGDANTLSADDTSSPLGANTTENAVKSRDSNNSSNTTATLFTGNLSVSSSSSVMSTSLHITSHTTTKTNPSEQVVSTNAMARRPSWYASEQQLPAQQVTQSNTSHVVVGSGGGGGSPARRSPYAHFGASALQHHSSSNLQEQRSSFGYSASVQRSSMTTPDSGISQMQSSQSCTPGPYSPHRIISNPIPAKTYCDKSVNSSPKRMISARTSPIEPFAAASVGREHALKHEIEQLQEKLKDTEERLQSLRIQHDSLSQLHRDLRESNTKLQEESDILKLDLQHLNECANILRSELQTARADRNEALELQKALQCELEESRQEKKRAQEMKEKDGKTIQDLQRQCREMERILMRKHPDSVSALIVAAKNTGKCANNDQENVNSRKLLEQRIAQLESDAKEQDLKAQQILANVQARFNSVQSKYETHIADLETQVLSLQEINTKLNEKIESQVRTLDYFVSKKAQNFYNNCTQTDANVVEVENEAGCSSDITKRVSMNSSGAANSNATNSGTITTATQTIVETKHTRDHSTNTIGTSSAVHSANSSTSSTANSTPNTSRPNSKQSGIRKPLVTAMGTLSTALVSKLPASHSDLTISAHHHHNAHTAAKEDAHLLATIRGMRVDLAIKDKAMQRLTRELEECKKTIKKLQREKEAMKSDKSQWNSYTCLNVTRRNHEQTHSEQMPATTDSQMLREAQNKLKLLESDYKMLHDKRLNDLKTLQSAHERELASCHETVRVLQQRLNERDEAFASQKRRKLPVDYYALKAKVSSLERRHSEREERLRMLVDALSKGRLTGAIEDLMGDNNNQRST
ncbi:uncharacterized protein [Eurosta solidaginis]|uniref:uncharacterized protein n=1 Tax=Eurosta solidaginis TaxID=178769 RepID=UPI0035311D30